MRMPCTPSGIALARAALSFDGGDDYVSIRRALIPGSGEFTVSVAFQATSLDGFREILSQEGGAGGTSFYLGRGHAGYIRAGDGWENTGVPFPADGQWHVLTLVRTATDTVLYLDGKEVKRRGGPIGHPVGTEFRIGRQFGVHGEYFGGRIAQLQVWNRARRPEEIAREMGEASTGQDSGLVAYLPLTTETGAEVVEVVTGTRSPLLGPTWESLLGVGEQRIAAAQQELRQLEALEQRYADELVAHQTGLTHGRSLELVSAVTGAPIWVTTTEAVATFTRRVMVEPPPAGCQTTRWMCLVPGAADMRPVRYGDVVTLWNADLQVNANLNARQIDRGIEAKPEPLGANLDGWRQFRLIHPSEPTRNSIIRSNDPVALECCFNPSDPARFIRPVKKGDRWWLERWEWTLPETHTFHLRLLEDIPSATIENNRRRLTSTSVIRLFSPANNQPVWVSLPALSFLGERAVVDPFTAGGLGERWRVLKEGAPAEAPLSYGDVIALRNLDPRVHANLNCRQSDRGVQATGQHVDAWRKFRLVHPDNPDSTAALYEGDAVVLECQFNPDDPVRILTLQRQDGHVWLHREGRDRPRSDQIFRLQLLEARSDRVEAQRMLEVCRAQVKQQALLIRSLAEQSAEQRKRGSLELTATSQGITIQPPAPGGDQSQAREKRFARLNPPMTLTLEARVYMREPWGEWTCIVGKGRRWDARDYHLMVRRNGVGHLMLHEAGTGNELLLETQPGVIQWERWHHIACVVDLARMRARLLVDGKECASRPVARTMATASGGLPCRWRGLLSSADAPLVFGCSPVDENPSLRLNGYLDEVRIWNIARSEQAIGDDLYRYMTGEEPGLAGCWRFGDVDNDRVRDRTVNGNHALIRNRSTP